MKRAILKKVFRVFSTIFSSKTVQTPFALHALRLVTQLAIADVSDASYRLFRMIMASDDLTDQHWEAARLAIRGAFKAGADIAPPKVVGLGETLKFLDYHLCLRLLGAGRDHDSSIISAIDAIATRANNYQADPFTVESIGKFNRTGPSFAYGVRSMMYPSNTIALRSAAIGLIAFTSDQWFNSPAPVEEMSEFCEHLAVFVVDDTTHAPFIRKCGVKILFAMLCSPEWRKHIDTRFWSMLVYCTQVPGEPESFKWCLRNAIELLEFTRGLPDGEGSKWWYGTLWFYYDRLYATARDEVERIARAMSLGHGLSDLNLYLNLIERDVARIRQEVDELRDEDKLDKVGMELRAQLVVLEGNHNKLARITRRRR